MGALAFAAVGCVTAAFSFSRPDARDDIRDFMIMDVCVDQRDRVLSGLSPTDPGCERHRDIRPNEIAPYHLHNFPANNAPCAARLGTILKDNFPVVKGGVKRIVSFYNHGVDGSCPGKGGSALPFGTLNNPDDGGSIQWYDDQYGFIMGSWSPVDLSSFVGSKCSSHPHSSLRYARGWVIGPRTLPSFRGTFDYALFASKLETGRPDLSRVSCPTRVNRALTTWVRDAFVYKSGLTLNSLISDHYSRGDARGDSPGKAEQVERTYWTREFGLTRWEKWARSDWVNPRTKRPAREAAEALYRSGRCSGSYVKPAKISPAFMVKPLPMDGVYAKEVYLPRTRERHVWYMTLCEDYSNIAKVKNKGTVPRWGDQMDATYWIE